MPSTADMQLFSDVRTYVRQKGDHTSNWSPLTNARFDACGNVRVAVNLDNDEMEIEKIDNMNPVVYIGDEGAVYRYHGEFEEVRADFQAMIAR